MAFSNLDSCFSAVRELIVLHEESIVISQQSWTASFSVNLVWDGLTSGGPVSRFGFFDLVVEWL